MRRYGLLLSRALRHGSEYISAMVVCTENGEHPLNCRSDGESEFCSDTPKVHVGLQYSDLGIIGHISEYGDLPFCGFEAQYHDPHSVTLPTAERMAKTLRRIQRKVKNDQANEAGDYLLSVGKAIHLTFVTIERGRKQPGSSYADSQWTFMTLSEGRNLFRRMIEDARADVRKAKDLAA